MSATRVYTDMVTKIISFPSLRVSTDVKSPQQNSTMECSLPVCTFDFTNIRYNVVTCKKVDLHWAAANVLHFFTGSEEAGILRKYNEHADRFLTGDRWIGAYGAIAMPQIRDCVELLRKSQSTRRAIVSMGGFEKDDDINRPSCWSFLHFIWKTDRLYMNVYQRSLNMSVMPYDAVLLSNILNYVSRLVWFPAGNIQWMVGSLHATDIAFQHKANGVDSIVYDYSILDDPEACSNLLKKGSLV